jgi:cold shock CspA family protein
MSEVEVVVVKFFDPTPRYGFIERENGKPSVFVHANDVIYGALPLYPGQRVEFTEVMDQKKGRRSLQRKQWRSRRNCGSMLAIAGELRRAIVLCHKRRS